MQMKFMMHLEEEVLEDNMVALANEITSEKANSKEYKAAILTPYLTEGIDRFGSPKEALKQITQYGLELINFEGIRLLQTDKGNHVKIWSPEYDARGRLEVRASEIRGSDLVITGSTEPSEEEVENFKGSGLVVARFSIFYGKPNRYTGNLPEEAGYSLDLPKSVGCALALLTSENVLESLVLREEARVRNAIEKLNLGHEGAPVLITPYLNEVLKIRRSEGGRR